VILALFVLIVNTLDELGSICRLNNWLTLLVIGSVHSIAISIGSSYRLAGLNLLIAFSLFAIALCLARLALQSILRVLWSVLSTIRALGRAFVIGRISIAGHHRTLWVPGIIARRKSGVAIWHLRIELRPVVGVALSTLFERSLPLLIPLRSRLGQRRLEVLLRTSSVLIGSEWLLLIMLRFAALVRLLVGLLRRRVGASTILSGLRLALLNGGTVFGLISVFVVAVSRVVASSIGVILRASIARMAIEMPIGVVVLTIVRLVHEWRRISLVSKMSIVKVLLTTMLHLVLHLMLRRLVLGCV